MSREVRRVPIDWKHPIEYNQHWEFQASTPFGREQPASRMHGLTEQFVSLMDDYPGAVADWEEDLRAMKAREGHDWEFALEYHLTGFQGRDDTEPTTHPYYADDDEEIEITLRDEDHLHELEVAKKEQERPDPARYMPVFDVPEDELGWCLYESVSEGTPVTPVFATAAELVDPISARLARTGARSRCAASPLRSSSLRATRSARCWSRTASSTASDVDADKIADLAKKP